MKTSIATVCLSGGLHEKLEAIAKAGFRGVCCRTPGRLRM